MVSILPGSGGGFQGFDLAQSHELLLRRLGEKSAAPSFTDEGVDLGRQLLGDDDVGALGVHRPTDSLTCYGISSGVLQNLIVHSRAKHCDTMERCGRPKRSRSRFPQKCLLVRKRSRGKSTAR